MVWLITNSEDTINYNLQYRLKTKNKTLPLIILPLLLAAGEGGFAGSFSVGLEAEESLSEPLLRKREIRKCLLVFENWRLGPKSRAVDFLLLPTIESHMHCK